MERRTRMKFSLGSNQRLASVSATGPIEVSESGAQKTINVPALTSGIPEVAKTVQLVRLRLVAPIRGLKS